MDDLSSIKVSKAWLLDARRVTFPRILNYIYFSLSLPPPFSAAVGSRAAYNARNRCIGLKINGYVTGHERGIPETKEDVYGEGGGRESVYHAGQQWRYRGDPFPTGSPVWACTCHLKGKLKRTSIVHVDALRVLRELND